MGDRRLEDAVLVARARGGCAASAAHLVEIYQVPLVEYLGRLLVRAGPRARCDAEDVAQETFIRMLRGLDTVDPKAPFGAWLFTIARRTCLNHLRSERRHARRIAARASVPEPASRGGPLEAAVAAETRDRLWEVASRTLPKRQFTALWLRYVEEMPVAGIARAIGGTAAAVKLHLLRGRRRLEPALADAGCGATPRAALRSTKRPTAAAGGVTVAGACLVAFWLAMSTRTQVGPPAATESLAIETLPLPDEIGERIVHDATTIVAEAIGLPLVSDVASVELGVLTEGLTH